MHARLLFALLVLLYALPAPAAMRWRQIDDEQPHPSARTGAAMAHVYEGQKSVLFGGCPVGDCTGAEYPQLLDDTWEWDGTQWTKLSPGTRPAARWGAAFAASPTGKAVLFGGRQNGNLRDTWTWANGTWSRVNVAEAQSPPALWFPAATPGSGLAEIALWGGRDASNVDNAVVWTFVDGLWSSWASGTTRPQGLYAPGLAFDSARKVFVVYGGKDSFPSAQHFEADCSTGSCQWTDLGMKSLPGRWGHAMVYDRHRGVTVLFGGKVQGPSGGREELTNEMWEWNGETWRAAEAPVLPEARMRHSLVYDDARQQLVLFGGTGVSGQLADTWVYEEIPDSPDAGSDRVDAGGGQVDSPDAGTPGNHGDAGTTGPDDEVPAGRSLYGCATAPLGLPVVAVLAALLLRRRRTLLCLALLLAASNAQAEAKQPRLAFLGISSSAVPRAEADSLGDFVQSEAAALGAWDVVGMREIETLLGLEQKKQLLGCDEDSACLAEIGGMLGVERTLSGSVARLGDTLLLNLWLLDSRKAKVVARTSRRVKADGSLEPLLDLVRPCVEELAKADGGAPALRTISFSAGVRGELDLSATGGVAALRLGVDGTLFGAALSLLAPALGARLEGLAHPVSFGPARPYLALGAAFVREQPLARAALGVELSLGRARLQLDVAREILLGTHDGLTHPLLVAAGAGWSF